MAAKKTSQAIHFISGSDEAAVKKAASELAAKMAPGADVFGLEIIDGGVDTVDAAIARTRETMTGSVESSLNVGMITTIRPRSAKDVVDIPPA